MSLGAILAHGERQKERERQELLDQFTANALDFGLADPSRSTTSPGVKPGPRELTKDVLAFARDQNVPPGTALKAAGVLDQFVGRPKETAAGSGPYKIGSRQKYRGEGGKQFEATFVGLDAENNPLWRNPVEIPAKDGAGGSPGTLKLENIVDNLRGIRNKIAGMTAGENILSEAMAAKLPEAIGQLQGDLKRESALLFDRFPDAAKKMGLVRELTEYTFGQDKAMKEYQLGKWNAQHGTYEVLDATGKVVGFYDTE